MKSYLVEVDGIRMRWVEDGAGVPVVLLHGIPTSPALWRKVLERNPGARLLAWEMVGYGESIPEGRERDVSVARQADYLAAWLRAIGVPSAVLVGHDLGGGVAHIAAVQHPRLCRGLMLINSVGYDSWPIPSVRAMRSLGPLVARLPDALLREGLRLLLWRGHDDRRVAEESLEVHLAPYRRHGGARALVRQAQALRTDDTRAVQGAIPLLRGRMPAAVLWGAADPFQKVRYGQRFADELGCELTRIDGGKHFVPEDHPDQVVAVLARVLAAVQTSPERPRPQAGP